jgi:ubiquitin-protein ligase E3 A
MIGILFGLAIFNDVIIDVKFPKVIYKKLLGEQCMLEDLEEIDKDMYNTLCFLRDTKDTNLEDTIGAAFEVEVENFGERIAIELKPGGGDILIDHTNKDEYIQLYLDWKFNSSIENYFGPFKKGFYKVADNTILEIIESDELELIICGTQELDFKDLEEGSVTTDGFTAESQTVKDFWEIVHEFDYDLKKNFLSFLTGCDRSPIKGLGSLRMIIGRQGPDSDKLHDGLLFQSNLH